MRKAKEIKQAFQESKQKGRKIRLDNWLFWAEKSYQSPNRPHPGPAWKWLYYAQRDDDDKIGGWDNMDWAARVIKNQ